MAIGSQKDQDHRINENLWRLKNSWYDHGKLNGIEENSCRTYKKVKSEQADHKSE